MLKDRLRSEPVFTHAPLAAEKIRPPAAQNRASNGLGSVFCLPAGSGKPLYPRLFRRQPGQYQLHHFHGSSDLFPNHALADHGRSIWPPAATLSPINPIPDRAAQFLRENLEFADRSFDGSAYLGHFAVSSPRPCCRTPSISSIAFAATIVIARFFPRRGESANRSALFVPDCRV